MPVLNQVVVFALEVFWGMFVGFLFDCYQQTRRIWRPRQWGTSLGDISFWVVVTSLTTFTLMLISWGEVRFYVFLAIGTGIFLYFKVLGRPVRKICRVLGGILGKLFKKTGKLINSFLCGGRSFLRRCRIFKGR